MTSMIAGGKIIGMTGLNEPTSSTFRHECRCGPDCGSEPRARLIHARVWPVSSFSNAHWSGLLIRRENLFRTDQRSLSADRHGSLSIMTANNPD